MMLDVAEATEILEHYFAPVTPDELPKNPREFCPELFEKKFCVISPNMAVHLVL
jgi:hypothetical protein